MISDETLGEKERLRKTSEFKNVYNKGRHFSVYGPNKSRFVIYALANSLGYNRIGFSISSKNIRLATQRNLIRRLFREIYRRNKRSLKKSYDLVFVIKAKDKNRIQHKEAEEIFRRLCKGAHIQSQTGGV